MKNLHLIPTDKPSKLVKLKMFGKDKLHLCKVILPIQGEEQYQHIYITSDEEIKEGDWYYHLERKTIHNTSEKADYFVNNTIYIKFKKIILTTDQELINDSVQAIDDDFLEWFVKNPSCEEVEVTTYGDYLSLHHSDLFHDVYKIIIPQEQPKQTDENGNSITYWGGLAEPKQETLTYTESAKKEERIFNFSMISSMMKQKTLEEAAKNWSNERNWCCELSFIKGAKWQAKRMYSEEEVYNLLCSMPNFFNMTIPQQIKARDKWFEQFKKK